MSAAERCKDDKKIDNMKIEFIKMEEFLKHQSSKI